jgi:hypothetical protein
MLPLYDTPQKKHSRTMIKMMRSTPPLKTKNNIKFITNCYESELFAVVINGQFEIVAIRIQK